MAPTLTKHTEAMQANLCYVLLIIFHTLCVQLFYFGVRLRMLRPSHYNVKTSTTWLIFHLFGLKLTTATLLNEGEP